MIRASLGATGSGPPYVGLERRSRPASGKPDGQDLGRGRTQCAAGLRTRLHEKRFTTLPQRTLEAIGSVLAQLRFRFGSGLAAMGAARLERATSPAF